MVWKYNSSNDKYCMCRLSIRFIYIEDRVEKYILLKYVSDLYFLESSLEMEPAHIIAPFLLILGLTYRRLLLIRTTYESLFFPVK